jgi:RNA polymerase sigma-70 factor (ECF subfamily)
MKTEKDIVKGILSGNETVLRQFYQQNVSKLTNFIRQRVSNEKDVEELVQDTLQATIEGMRDFTFRSTLYTYMCGIAKRRVIDFYRKQKIKRIVFSRMPAIEKLLVFITTPEEQLDEKLLEQKILHTFEKISPQYRLLLKLKYIEELPIKEIASKLNISFKSVESMLFRARKAFVMEYQNI